MNREQSKISKVDIFKLDDMDKYVQYLLKPIGDTIHNFIKKTNNFHFGVVVFVVVVIAVVVIAVEVVTGVVVEFEVG